MSSIPHFPTTSWSLIARAGDPAALGHRDALDQFLARYLRPLRTYLVIARRIDPDQSDDILQEFLAHKVLHRHLIARAERSRGRFRTFLLRSLDRFVINHFQKRDAQKRGRRLMTPLNACQDVISPQLDPYQIFIIAWAREILSRAIYRLKSDYAAAGSSGVFELFDARVLEPALAGATPEPLEPLVSRLGLQSAAEASNLLATAKRKFARILRAVVSEYCSNPSEVEDELREIREIVSQTSR